MRSSQNVLAHYTPTSVLLGLTLGHDASVALVKGDGELLYASSEERFSQKKHDDAFPQQALEAGITQCGISFADISAVYISCKPLAVIWRLFRFSLFFFPSSYPFFYQSLTVFISRLYRAKKYLENSAFSGEIYYVDHHLSHASHFFLSPYENALVVVADGGTEENSFSAYYGRNGQLTLLESRDFTQSLGLLYSIFARFLGLGQNGHKLASLASWGEPLYCDTIAQYVGYNPATVSFSLPLSSLNLAHKSAPFRQSFFDHFGPKRENKEPLSKKHADIAASLQVFAQQFVVDYSALLQQKYGETSLVWCGGIAFNTKINAALHASGLWENIFVPPHPGAGGCSLGAALWGLYSHSGAPRIHYTPRDMAFLGYHTTRTLDEVKDMLRATPFLWREDAISEKGWVEDAAELLKQNELIALFCGNAEFGPRALGHRSILASPFDENIIDKVNVVKGRENFRPFSACSIANEMDDFFAGKNPSPFCMFAHGLKSNRFEALATPDKSTSIQTIDSDFQPILHRILQAFEYKTGVGSLLHTSFNAPNKPTVNSIADALAIFANSNIYAIYIELEERILIVKKSR